MSLDGAAPPASAADRLAVLVVDDEINIRRTLTYCLEAEGHEVAAVSDPADAVDAVRRRAFARASRASVIGTAPPSRPSPCR